MSFGDGNLRSRVAALEEDRARLMAAVSGLWSDLSSLAPEAAERWLEVCPVVKEAVDGHRE